VSIRRLDVALRFDEGSELPVARLGWDATARQAVGVHPRCYNFRLKRA
jgi:hypothetical protein